MKYNVGDKVRIKSKEWYKKNKNKRGDLFTSNLYFPKQMSIYCGKECTITKISCSLYRIDIDNGAFFWNDEVFEDEEPGTTTSIIQDIAKAIRERNLGVPVKEEDGKLIIEPLNVKEDLPIDAPVMVCNDVLSWHLKYYAGGGKTWRLGKKYNAEYGTTDWNYIIPFDKFNPNNIEESLKHNIVKP